MATKTLKFPISAGLRFFIRLHAHDSASTGVVTLTRTVGPRPPIPAGLDVPAVIDETPGWLPIEVAAGSTDGVMTFTVDGSPDVITSRQLDASGNLSGSSVILPSLSAGAHVLHMTDSQTGVVVDRSFTVTKETTVRPDPPAPDVSPVLDALDPAAPVKRWELIDPIAHAFYTVPINPETMSTPHAARVFSTQHSTSPTGRTITFEGGTVAVDWDVSGTILTQAYYEAWEYYQGLNRRFWVIDHLDRIWLVTLESFDATPKRSSTNPWAFGYKAKFKIYGAPAVGPTRRAWVP